MDRGAGRIDGHCYRHILYFELVDGLHAEIGEGHDASGPDGSGNEIGGAADRDQIGGLLAANRLDGRRTSFCLANHGDRPGLRKHHVSEFVHARRGGRAGGSHDLVADRIDWPDVVDHTPLEVDRQGLAAREHFLDALVRRVTAGQDFSRQQEHLPGSPAGHVRARQRIHVHAGSHAAYRAAS